MARITAFTNVGLFLFLSQIYFVVGEINTESFPTTNERVYPGKELTVPYFEVGAIYTYTFFVFTPNPGSIWNKLTFGLLSSALGIHQFEGPFCTASAVAADRSFSSAYCVDGVLKDVDKFNTGLLGLLFQKHSVITFGLKGTSQAQLQAVYRDNDATWMRFSRQHVVFPLNYNFDDSKASGSTYPNDICLIKLPIEVRRDRRMSSSNFTVITGKGIDIFAAGYDDPQCGLQPRQAYIANAQLVNCNGIVLSAHQACVSLSYGNDQSVESFGNWGGPVFKVDKNKNVIQIAVLSRQQKKNPFGSECTKKGVPQVMTYIDGYNADFKPEFSCCMSVREYRGV